MKTSRPDDKQKTRKVGADNALDAAEVADYLNAHPDFLLDHADLLAVLTPPSHNNGNNILDLQLFMLQKLQKEVRKLSSNWSELIATSRSNMATQAQVHTAILAMLKSESLSALFHTITHDFADMLNMDAVTLCLEEDTASALMGRKVGDTVVRIISPGTVDQLMGPGREILLRSKAEPLDDIFGPAATLVRSDALIRLSFGDQAFGMLALGARETDKFHPGQGTELMGFLARSLEMCIDRWKAQ